MSDFIIHGDIVYSADKDDLITAEGGYAVCTGGLCAGVFRELPERYKALPVHDFTGMLVMPGMVDLHIHAPQYAYRGLGMDMELLDWLDNYAFPEERKYRELDYAQKAYTIFADAIKKSATTRAVIFGTMYRQSDELLMELMEGTGIVSYVGKVNMDRNAPAMLTEDPERSVASTGRYIDHTLGKYKNTYPIITPRFVPSCSDGVMEGLGRLTEKYRIPVQSHLSENPGEIEWVKELCPWAEFYGAAYDRWGLFGSLSKTVMAHCVYSSDKEIALMKERGVYIAHCPASNMNVASGIAPMRQYLDEGLKVGLGTDVAGGQTESVFTSIVEAIQVSKLYWRLVDSGSKPLSFNEAFYMATRGGGEFFGKVGAFDEGYEFDAIVIDDSALPHPQELTLSQRAERTVYLNGDIKALKAKFCRGTLLSQESGVRSEELGVYSS